MRVTSSPTKTAQRGCDPFAVLRRAKNVKNTDDAERNVLLDDAERIETWAARLVLGAIVLEAAVWISPLCPFLFKLGNFVADAAVAIGIYGEMRFGHVVGDILKVRLAESIERAEEARRRTAEIERLTAWRRIKRASAQELVSAIVPLAADLDLLIEFQMNDPEAYLFAREILDVFSRAGTPHVRIGSNSYLSGMVFDTWIAASPPVNIRSIVEAFLAADITVREFDKDLSTHLRDAKAPNIYLFVGPKLPEFLKTENGDNDAAMTGST